MNNYNQDILKAQMELKRERNENTGMTDHEYLMNKNLLEKAAKTLTN